LRRGVTPRARRTTGPRAAGTRVADFRAAVRAVDFFAVTFRVVAFFAADFARALPTLFRFGAADFFLGAVFALAATFRVADFRPARSRPPTFLAISNPLTNLPWFGWIIRAMAPAVQGVPEKLIADGLPVRATTPIGVSLPDAASI
jgi:hypothetical protein